MSNNNVAIVSLMAQFDEKSINVAAEKLGKTTAKAFKDIGKDELSQDIVSQFTKAMNTVKGKLKGVNLSSYTNNILDSIISDKDIAEKIKELEDFISNIKALSKSLSGLDSNALNSMNTKQLDAIINKQKKIEKKNEEIINKTKSLNSTANSAARTERSTSSLVKKYGVSDYEQSYESLKKVLQTNDVFNDSQQKSIKHLSEMLSLYSDMEKVQPEKGTKEAISYSVDLLTIVKEIQKTSQEIDLYTNGKASKFVNKNYDSMKSVNEYNVESSKSDFVKSGLSALQTQKAKLEKELTEYIGKSVEKNLQKMTDNSEKYIDSVTKKAEKLQTTIDTLSQPKSDKPLVDNIVDESQLKSLEELEDRLLDLQDKYLETDANGYAVNDLDTKELKEFISLYNEYTSLLPKDNKFESDLPDTYKSIIDSDEALQKYADSIQKVREEKQKLEDVKGNTEVDSSKHTEELKEQQQQIEKTEQAEKDLQETHKASSNTIINVDTEQALSNINAVKESLESLPSEKNIKIFVNNTDYSSVPLLSNEEGKTVNMFRGIKNAWSGLVNDQGIGFFTDKLELAVDYADELAKDGKVIQANLALHNPLEVDGNGARWDQIDFEGVKQKTDDIIEKAKQLGYDGVIFKNIRDGFTDTEADLSNVVAVFDALQVKNEQVIRSINAETGKVKDLTQPDISSETDVMQEVEKATEDAVQSKKDFATANEGVQSSIDDSENPLKLEAELMDQIAKSAREAADAKKEFVEANKQVKNSADDNDSELDNNHEKKKQDDSDIQKQKDAFNKSNLNAIDMEIKKREEEAKINSSLLKSQMEQQVQYENQLKKINSTASNYRNDVNGYKKDSGKTGYLATNNYLQKIEKYESQVKSLESYVSDLHDQEFITDKQLNKLEVFKKRCEEAKQELKDMKASDKGSWTVDVQKEIDKINSDLSKNSNYSKQAKEQLKAFVEQLKSGNISDTTLKAIHEEFLRITNAEKLAGREGKNFFDIVSNSRLHQMAAQLAGMFSIYDVINAGREGINVVRELDTALTEMRKVSSETVQSLKDYQSTTFDTADSVGTTAKQIQNSTADWMRLGESMSQAAKSAKDSNILLNVSEFDSIDEATESLVSMSQAYKDLDKMDIINVLNNIGNNYSISTDGLATALKDSASALVTANNDLNEAVSLTTAGNAITQDPSKVGAGLRTISLRLVGTEQAKQELSDLGEETDGMITTVSKLRDTIMDATKAASKDGKGFDILDDNGNYKSTYEIMQGLADLYDDIVKKDKELGTNNLNLLLETIAGKNRSNIAASILQNGDMLRSVYEDAQNSDGSAENELNSYLDSIEGKWQQLTNRVQEFWSKLIDSEAVKNGIDLLSTLLKGATDFVEALDQMQLTIPTLLGMLGSFGMSKLGEGSLD